MPTEAVETRTPCLCCGRDLLPLFQAPDFDRPDVSYRLVRCSDCGFAQISEPPGEEALSGYYSADYYGSGAQAKFNGLLERLVILENNRRAKFLTGFLETPWSEPTRAVDVGCGRGNFLKALRRLGFDCHGTEVPAFPVPTPLERLRFWQIPVGELPLPAESVDLISIWHVLEHLPDPNATLSSVSGLLRKSGVLAIAVPNFDGTQRRLFGKHWFHLDLPRHLHHFSPAALEGLLKKNGFEAVFIGTSALDQNLYGFIQSALNALFPRRPNWLYSALKKGTLRQEHPLYFLLQAAIAGVLLPFAFLENAISALFQRGSTLVIVGRKTTSSRI